MSEKQSFGELLKRFRRAAYLTQQDLAARAGYSSHYVSMLERGVRRPQPLTADLLATAMALSDADRKALLATAEHLPTLYETHSASAPRLPALIGRARDLERVVQLLTGDGTQALTLIGPGGVGKTLLARHAAAALAPAFADGAIFVDLAALSDADDVVREIVRSLGLRVSGTQSMFDRLVDFLGDRETLLLLDSFEHVIEAATVVADLLARCPRLRLLITSRTPLRVQSEQEFHVQPLALPEQASLPRFEDLRRYPALAMFVQRARLVEPDLDIDDTGMSVVADICRRVDGLPLAIELAASRVSHLPLAALRDLLEHRLRVLTGGPRDLPSRQQRMRDAIAWSYDLLGPSEQATFRQLSVFSVSWSLEAAEAVCTLSDPDRDVLDNLRTLVDNSLVVLVEVHTGESRYRMLDTIREYASERLAAAGEVDATRRRHAAYYVQLSELAEVALQGRDQEIWFPRLEREHDNLRAALGWLLQGGEAEQALRLAGSVWRFWQRHGDFREGRDWIEKGLAIGEDVPPAVRAKAYWGASWLAYQLADYERTKSLSSEHLALARETGDALSVRNALTGLGMSALAEGRYAEALPPLEEALDACNHLGDIWQVATSFLNLATANMLAGDLDRAHSLFDEALRRYRERGDGVFEARCIQHLGHIALLRGDYAEAARLFDRSLRAQIELGEKMGIADGLEAVAAVRSATGETRDAALLIGAASCLREMIGVPPYPFLRTIWEPYVLRAAEQMGEDLWRKARQEGHGLSPEQAVAAVLDQKERS